MEGDRKELRELLEGYSTAILTTRGADGHFHGRPMEILEIDPSGELWFATSLDTQKISDVEADARCGLVLHAAQSSATYVSISGSAELVRDREELRRRWKPGMRAWFPDGPQQADLALIRVKPEHVEYVHPDTGKLRVFFTIVRRLVAGWREELAPKKELDLTRAT